MATKKIRFDSDRAADLTAAPVGLDPDTATRAARYVTREAGDHADDVLRALGLTTTTETRTTT